MRRLDLGGGLGVGYRGEPEVDLAGYAALVRELGRGLDLELVFEPGRYLVAAGGDSAQPRSICQRRSPSGPA